MSMVFGASPLNSIALGGVSADGSNLQNTQNINANSLNNNNFKSLISDGLAPVSSSSSVLLAGDQQPGVFESLLQQLQRSIENLLSGSNTGSPIDVAQPSEVAGNELPGDGNSLPLSDPLRTSAKALLSSISALLGEDGQLDVTQLHEIEARILAVETSETIDTVAAQNPVATLLQHLADFQKALIANRDTVGGLSAQRDEIGEGLLPASLQELLGVSQILSQVFGNDDAITQAANAQQLPLTTGQSNNTGNDTINRVLFDTTQSKNTTSLAPNALPVDANSELPKGQSQAFLVGSTQGNSLDVAADTQGLLNTKLASIDSTNSSDLSARLLNIAANGNLITLNDKPGNGIATAVQEQLSGSINADTFPSRLNTPLANEQWGKQLGQRINWLISQGISSAEIQLNPAELGPLHLRIEQAEQSAKVAFAVQQSATREIIEAQIPRLRELFEEQGLNLVNVESHDMANSSNNQSAEDGNLSGQQYAEGTSQASNNDQDIDQFVENSQVVVLTLHRVDTYI